VPSPETYVCLRKEGVTFVTQPCTGVVVQGVQDNLRAAKAAGLQVGVSRPLHALYERNCPGLGKL